MRRVLFGGYIEEGFALVDLSWVLIGSSKNLIDGLKQTVFRWAGGWKIKETIFGRPEQKFLFERQEQGSFVDYRAGISLVGARGISMSGSGSGNC